LILTKQTYIKAIMIFFTFIPLLDGILDTRNLFITVIIAIFVSLLMLNIKKRTKFDIIDLLFLIYIIIIGYYYVDQPEKTIAMKGLLAHIKIPIFYYIGKIINYRFGKNDTNKLLNSILSIGLFVCLCGLFQYFFAYDALIKYFSEDSLFTLAYTGIGESRHKQLYSLLFSPLSTAYIIQIAIIIELIQILFKQKYLNLARESEFFHFIILSILSITLLLTFHRSSLIGLLLSCIILFKWMINNRTVLFKGKYFNILIFTIILISIFYIIFTYENNYLLTIFKFNDPAATSSHYYYLQKGIDFLYQYPNGLGLGASTSEGSKLFSFNTWNESQYFFIST